ncbi:MAG TPA: osmoprotectant NAGGN system M42 family peptidase [Gammaproteobacteria bacterium]|nr:osmoprotectant NAGGN system M42 family peptidase [Gammaproteobacteria bacterium]
MSKLSIDADYLARVMLEMLNIPSPTGFTDEIVRYTGERLKELGIPFELTRRGAIRADLKGRQASPDRAIVVHLDTIGAMVKDLKENGRLEIVSVGTWSARFAEGARVTIFTDHRPLRGTILPLKASGHTFNEEVDTQPVAWTNVEVRVDEVAESIHDLAELGINVGDFIAVDANPEIDSTGFINSRHLDDKAGVAVVLAAAKSLQEHQAELPVDCHLLFTISEEVGSGASAVLHRDVAEMVTIDTAPSAPGQNAREFGVTIAMQDSDGPFDYHLTHKLLELCCAADIPHRRDVFRYYHSDSASAIEAGNDIRNALTCFGVDATHGYERTHMNALLSLAELMTCYAQSEPTFLRDKEELAPLEGFPTLPVEEQEVWEA